MKIHVESENINAMIERQLKLWETQKKISEKKLEEENQPKLLITISRAMGSMGEEVAAKLSQLTGFQLFDKEIMEAIAKNSGVQTKIVELLDEETKSDLMHWLKGTLKGEIFGRSDYIKSLTRSIGSIMKHGNAILVGRGANVIIGMKRGFNLRIVGSFKTRVERVAQKMNISQKEAEKLVRKSDKGRAIFIKTSFGMHSGDPSFFDMVLNTDCLDLDDTVELALLAYSKKKHHMAK
ncbi:MAG: cytidylate kinase-like family protein [Nitrospinae bacterium]|nr:cytidylate kinase-like family protein [Nitrospinota bacterium]